MNLLDKEKTFIIPYANTLFIMADGQAHAIPMRREAKRKACYLPFDFQSIGNQVTWPSSRGIRAYLCQAINITQEASIEKKNEPVGRKQNTKC